MPVGARPGRVPRGGTPGQHLVTVSPEIELLALICEREAYMNRDQVLHVMRVQAQAAEASGQTPAFQDVAVHFKLVLPADMKYAMSIADKLAVAAGMRRPLGYYLLEMGVLKPSQVLEALEEQTFYGSRLGEILIRNGWATDDDIERALALQAARHQPVA